MSEIHDLVLPVLQRIQTDLTRLNGKLDNVAEEQLKQGEKLDAIERYMIFHMGLTTQQKADIEAPQGDMADVKKRLAALEAQS
jgi:predicted homoserine dehydrogenase-like protein